MAVFVYLGGMFVCSLFADMGNVAPYFCWQLEGDNLFKWEVAIFGPPDTIFTGGYFKVLLLPHWCLRKC